MHPDYPWCLSVPPSPNVMPAEAGTQEVVAFTAPKHLGQRAWIPAWSLVEGFALPRRGDDGDIRVIK